VRYGDRRNMRWSIGMMKSLSILIGWYWDAIGNRLGIKPPQQIVEANSPASDVAGTDGTSGETAGTSGTDGTDGGTGGTGGSQPTGSPELTNPDDPGMGGKGMGGGQFPSARRVPVSPPGPIAGMAVSSGLPTRVGGDTAGVPGGDPDAPSGFGLGENGFTDWDNTCPDVPQRVNPQMAEQREMERLQGLLGRVGRGVAVQADGRPKRRL
jgi:hypothetical protein